MIKFKFALSCLLLALFAQAQPQINPEELNKTYKGHTLVVLNREQNIRIGMNKNDFQIESDHVVQVYHIDNKNVGYSERQIGYSPTFFEIKKLEARTYIPEANGKYKKVEVTSFKDEGQVDAGNIFYDGYRYKKFTFSSIGAGVISEMKYTYNYKDPSHLGPMYFFWGPPHQSITHTVTVSDDVKINYKFFGDSTLVEHKVTRIGKNTVHSWQAKNVPTIKSYDDAANDKYFEPHVYVYIESYKDKSGWKTLFGDVARLYKFNYNYIKNVNVGAPSELIKSIMDSIKQISSTEDDVIKHAYHWVQKNMRYIAFEDGLGGQIPREANDVCDKRFGDCKDFAGLITTLLKEANITAYLTWIGSRDLPYTYSDLPLGYASNHMIVAVLRNGNWVFIDGTSKHTPYGLPSGFTQGKEGLIAISPDSFVVAKVPIVPLSVNTSQDSAYLTIDKSIIYGSGQLHLVGYQRSNIVDNLYYTGVNKLNDYLKQLTSVGNNKCEVTSVTSSDYSNNETPLVIRSTFTLPDYVKEIESEMYLSLCLRKAYSGYKIDTTGNRMAPKEIHYLANDQFVYVLEIPKGYTIKTIPAQVNYTSPNLDFSFVYTVSGTKIILKQTTVLKSLLVNKPDFADWNKAIDLLNKAYKEQVILTKSK